MIRQNKLKLILSSLIIIIPCLVGLVLWDVLPEQMATHWGIDGNADGWSGRILAVFGIPVIILLLHWLCILFTTLDKKNRDQNAKVFGIIYWICPATSVYASAIVYATAFGMPLNMSVFTLIFIGLMFIVIGNYLPKCKQNSTIGIKVPWALNNEENWNKTHRFGGKVWVVGGAIFMLCAFLPEKILPYVLLILILPLALIPCIYSYVYYRKQLKLGTATKADSRVVVGKYSRIVTWIILGAVAVLLVVLLVISFTGELTVRYDDTSFTVEASYWDDLTVDYGDIEGIEYREDSDAGDRVSGFGSPRLGMGAFRNEEFGGYTRYTYAKCETCVVLRVNGKAVVINLGDEQSTQAFYEELLSRMK
ncbi:MAG: SdpI family protein [Clostridia bacterium]|nr:SdpI family protein [Clostridia bacterium]